ncbi:MAG: murein biosynthesis integral membrane protein MurJ [Thermodesulfobacteriota bacterium]
MTRAAGVVGFWTVLSRVLGFVRDMVVALALGAGFGSDAFFVAFRIPNLLRRLFAEGALSAAFVPTFVETLQKDGKQDATRLASKVMTFSAVVLALVAAAGIFWSPLLVRLTAPGFFDLPDKFALTVHLNRVMFPYIFFISLVALMSGVLNSVGHFAAPAAAPVVLNISMIAAVTLAGSVFGTEPVYALAWGVAIAGIVQVVMQIPVLSLSGMRIRPDFSWNDAGMKRIGGLFVPAAFGGAVYQINVLVGTILASMLPSGSVSWLWYADRLVELPLGVFAIALGTAVLPSMSRLAGNGDTQGIAGSVSFALRLIAFFIVPASVGLIVLREPIVAVLFQRGLFTAADTIRTAEALLWYTVGLWAFSGLKVVTQAFFALKDTTTPLRIAVIAVVVNLAAGVLLMGPMAHSGLALATSLSASANLLILFFMLRQRLGQFPSGELVDSLLRVCGASALMAVALFWARPFGNWTLGFTSRNGFVLLGAIIGGIAVFGIVAYLFRCRELNSVLGLVRRRTPGRRLADES